MRSKGFMLRLDLPDLRTATVQDVLRRLPDWVSPPKERRVLMHNGRRLEAGSKLAEYGVMLNDDIHIEDSQVWPVSPIRLSVQKGGALRTWQVAGLVA